MKEMTCREFDEVVHGFVRMELLDVSVREAALEHAARCEACAQRMGDAAALAEMSEAMRRASRDAEAPAGLEASLSAAFRNHHRRASWRHGLEWAGVGAAAAVLLVFLWTVRRPHVPSVSSPGKNVPSESQAPADAKSSVTSPRDQASESVSASAAETADNETYSASDFVPVPFTSAISSDDPGMVVRVQLTRASLAQLGYPLAEAPDEDLISADVLVGEDGWPRGVKLIQ